MICKNVCIYMGGGHAERLAHLRLLPLLRPARRATIYFIFIYIYIYIYIYISIYIYICVCVCVCVCVCTAL